MPNYHRIFRPGGRYFFTVVTERRAPILCAPLARACLRQAILAAQTIRPFTLEAIVLLPNHLHTIWTLPDGDADYSFRWSYIKKHFVREYLPQGGEEQERSASRVRLRRRGVWQRRFWEHCLKDGRDYQNHLDYIHFNPVKHGYARCPHAWEWSTFHRWCQAGRYEPDWRCECRGQKTPPPVWEGIDERGEL